MVSVLEDKVAVVTGAGRGLGKLAALRLAEKGAHVVLIARSRDQLEGVADEIRGAGGHATALPMDLGAQTSHEFIREKVMQAAGAPSVLVNAAGVFGPMALIRDVNSADWIETLLVNTVSHFLTCRAFVGGMMDAGWGRIINISSAASLHPPGPVNSAYGTSKSALNQFTRHLAAELKGSGVTANVIHPGDVKTEMWASIRAGADALGSEADGYRAWVEKVEQTGGDDPGKAADLIVSIVEDTDSTKNGRFLWIKDGIQKPIPSWGDD